MINFRDPSVALRLLLIVLSAISLILLIAGTAIDEYVDDPLMAMGCQKLRDKLTGYAHRSSFKYMHILSLVIIIVTSVLCALQAAATVFNVLFLLKGSHQKPATVLPTILIFGLLAVIVMANINFTETNYAIQKTAIAASPEYIVGLAEYAAGAVGKALDKGIGKLDKEISKLGGDWTFRRKRAARGISVVGWGQTYSLVCTAFAFAIINQILLMIISHLGGGSSLGSLKDKACGLVRDKAALIRLAITLFNVVALVLMVAGTAMDRYIDRDMNHRRCVQGTRLYDCHKTGVPPTNIAFKDMRLFSMILLGMTCVACLLLFIASVLCFLQYKKNKTYTMPLLGLSVITTAILLASIVLACLNFTQKRYYPGEPHVKPVHQTSFSTLCAAFAFSILTAVLNFLGKKMGGGGGGGPSTGGPSTTNTPMMSSSKPSSVQPSSGGAPSSK